MEKERSYGFRHFLNTVHKPDRRDHGVKAKKGEVLVDDSWSIVVPEKAERLVVTAAKDLQDYLFTSMNVSVPLKRHADLAGKGGRRILLAAGGDLPEAGEKLTVPRSFVLACGEESISVRGFDARGVAQGCYYIEDVMNLREAPLVGKTSGLRREPLFSPRMVHSGWGIDQFPDGHLHAMAHAGFDAVLVFAKGPDKTTAGYLDFNELVDRAASFGLDVYLYSYLKSSKHPDDPGAKEFYESTYGELFRQCPRAKGVVLVGESCEFPSKDTVNTSGKPWDQSQDHGIPCPKPSPGWWPCLDYPQWLDMVKKAVRKHNPDADVIFWTYNWGWAPEADRLKLVKALPTDVSLQVTFEMFEQIRRGGVADMVMDYTISSPGPGAYFVSEAKAAKKRGLRLYTMSNTGGMTWDFGVAPYVPAPFQWARRHEALHHARRSWGLSGLMESHHYGWYPSVVSEAAKWSFWSNSPDTEELLGRIAARDFGAKAAPHAVRRLGRKRVPGLSLIIGWITLCL